MSETKGWLQTQMQNAKSEVNHWQSWKKDTLRREISGGVPSQPRGDSALVRSSSSGRFVIVDRKKQA